MAVKVIDTSAIAAFLFGEAEAEEIGVRLIGATLVAPALFDTELAQVCVKKIRRAPAQQMELLAAFRRRRRLRIEAMTVDHDAVLTLALATGLTAYDASYLWLARDIDAELVTLDRQLARATAL